MSINHPTLSEGYVPAYQMSAVPYITSSLISAGEVHTYNFPQVTRFFNVINLSAVTADKIAVSVTELGLQPAAGNFFSLPAGTAFRDEIRTTALFISGTSGTAVEYQLVVGLTSIPERNFLTVTGSNGHVGVG